MVKPLLVNISGMRGAGVSAACDRIQRCLNGQRINTVIVTLRSARDVKEFKDNLILNKYAGVRVVLFDKHFNTESAIRRRLNTELWFDDSVLPHISLLMSPATSTKDRHEAYLKIAKAHYGTDNHHVISTKGAYGKLYAAGNIKNLILRELSHA